MATTLKPFRRARVGPALWRRNWSRSNKNAATNGGGRLKARPYVGDAVADTFDMVNALEK